MLANHDRAGVHLVEHGVVVQGPLNVGLLIAHGEPGDDGRSIPGLGEKRDSAEVHGAVEYVALVGHECATKGRVKEILLGDGPGNEFPSRTALVFTDRGVGRSEEHTSEL